MSRFQKMLRFARAAMFPPSLIIVGFIALRSANSTWASAAVSFTVIFLLATTVCALFGSPMRRAFRSGFAICGGGYFLLFWFGYPGNGNTDGLSSFINTAATTKALYLLHDHWYPDSSAILVPDGVPSAGGFRSGGAFDIPDADPTANESTPATSSTDNPTIRLAQAAASIPTAPAPNLLNDYELARCFLIIGQCLWAIILGWLGGWFAQFLAWRQKRAA